MAARVHLNQTPREFTLLLAFLTGRLPTCFLEIGTEAGGSFLMLSTVLVHMGAYGASITLNPHNPGFLNDLVGRNVLAFEHIGSSHETQAIEFARSHALYDFIFIDGDHSYQGAKQDWENYRPLLKQNGVIIFHDIADKKFGCYQLWQEIRENYRTVEFVDHGAVENGIGVLLP